MRMQAQSVTDGLPRFRQVSHQVSLMQLGLETGYKHQLRVHLAQALGCAYPQGSGTTRRLTHALLLRPSGPILGDTKYGGGAISGGVPTSLALHCRTISLLVRFLHLDRRTRPTSPLLTDQRYKKEGPKKRFDLSISAALPSNFADTCQRHGITLPPQAHENVIQLDGQPCSSEQLLHYTGGVIV